MVRSYLINCTCCSRKLKIPAIVLPLKPHFIQRRAAGRADWFPLLQRCPESSPDVRTSLKP